MFSSTRTHRRTISTAWPPEKNNKNLIPSLEREREREDFLKAAYHSHQLSELKLSFENRVARSQRDMRCWLSPDPGRREKQLDMFADFIESRCIELEDQDIPGMDYVVEKLKEYRQNKS